MPELFPASSSMAQQFSLPIQIPFANGANGVSEKDRDKDSKFPHTRAQLSAIARQHSYDGSDDGDELQKVPGSLVTTVVGLLVDEKEDELKTVLKETFPGMNEETVGGSSVDVRVLTAV